jgi:hypothetical protein
MTKACSPYNNFSGANVHDGGVLTIEAGVTAKFEDNTVIQVGQGSSGKLVANGTAQAPITLTSSFSPPNPGDWYGLTFYESTATGSKVSYTIIDYAGGNYDAAIVGETGMPKNSVTLDHVTINNSLAAGILVSDATSGFVVISCIMDGSACP